MADRRSLQTTQTDDIDRQPRDWQDNARKDGGFTDSLYIRHTHT